ncbi:hypothetical protein [uncultured Treponema sp.]|uniref:hypothetical protein n=1 Tax=uncultured Treponema sp. TaxID=162155 RepID=UPI0025DDB5D7|nr:hypothetical protein [uncultured Treponema sp.]
MKKSKIFLVLAGLALIFTACSDVSNGDDASLSTGYANASKEVKSLTLNATSDKKLLTFPVEDSSSRTILPAAVDASGNSVKFFLAYTDQLAATPTEKMWTGSSDTSVVTPAPVIFTSTDGSTTKGTIALTFDVSVYSFTLFCVPASKATSVTSKPSALSNAMFVGYANADLRYNDDITFYLTADKSTGNGDVELRLWSTNTKSKTDLYEIAEGYAVTAAIYKKNDETVLIPTSGQSQSIMTGDFTDDTNGRKLIGSASYSKFAATGVKPGSYTFAVTFTSATATYYYSDEIIILPNQKTDFDVFIPKVYEEPPAPPSAFMVAYADPLVKTDDYYYAQFAWSDNSNNEREFQIDLLKVDDAISNIVTSTDYKKSAVPSDDSSWSTSLNAYGLAATDIVTYKWAEYQNSSFNPNPEKYSLIKNNTTAVFMLPLGSRYLARIRAVNDAGPSAYAYLNITNVKTGAANETIDIYDRNGDGSTASESDVDVAGKIYCTETKTFGSSDKKIVAYSSVTPANADIPLNGNYSKTSVTFKAFEKKYTDNDPSKDVISDVLTINRYRIKYNLNDGEFKGALSSGTYSPIDASELPDTVIYATQKYASETSTTPVGETILIPDGNVKGADTGTGTDYLDVSGAVQSGKTLNLLSVNAENINKFSRWLLYSTQDSNKVSTDGGNRYPTTQYYWKKDTSEPTNSSWNTTELSGVSTRLNPNVYTGHENLELFASYALDTTAKVVLADYTAYEWQGYGETYSYEKKANAAADNGTKTNVSKLDPNLTYDDANSKWVYAYKTATSETDSTLVDETADATLVTRSDISLVGLAPNGTTEVELDGLTSNGDTDTPKKVLVSKNDYVTVSATATPSLKFTLDQTMQGYDTVTLKIRSTTSGYNSYSYKKDVTLGKPYDDTSKTWTSAASITVNVKAWTTGKYEVTFVGSNKKYPNKLYTFPLVIDLRD